ncbi:hypothetical protein B0H16DRAFT_1762964 [Mycena metata]|uniref:Uncharacterized protein n=1 Tax=Mycena metata TaxID=1033252 RepID=A0AAD7MXR3_9AGAR|nr:hypothetical protein B0H16DRAFT_1762964 [Mycena metata]
MSTRFRLSLILGGPLQGHVGIFRLNRGQTSLSGVPNWTGHKRWIVMIGTSLSRIWPIWGNVSELATSPPGLYLMHAPKDTVLPYYMLPALNTTLGAWQSNSSDGTPALTWNSTSDTPSGASRRFQVPGVNLGPVGVAISFGGIDLLDVERGAWFDNFTAAMVVENPPADDPNAAVNKAAFTKHFGTPESPGPTSTYTDKVLVAYKPKAVLRFASLAEVEMYSVTAPSGGMWGVGAVSDSEPEFIYEPKTEDAYIVGIVVHSYWEDNSTSTLTSDANFTATTSPTTEATSNSTATSSPNMNSTSIVNSIATATFIVNSTATSSVNSTATLTSSVNSAVTSSPNSTSTSDTTSGANSTSTADSDSNSTSTFSSNFTSS